jgi:hypothetical protein
MVVLAILEPDALSDVATRRSSMQPVVVVEVDVVRVAGTGGMRREVNHVMMGLRLRMPRNIRRSPRSRRIPAHLAAKPTMAL